MKRKKNTAIICTIIAGVLWFGTGNAQPREEDWETFSKNLVHALQSDNEGLQQSAMCLIIEHAEKLHVEDGAFALLQIFRHHEHRGMRVLAMMSLYKIQHNFGMFLIQRSVTLDPDAFIRKRSRHLMALRPTNTALRPALPGDIRFGVVP